MSRTSRSPHQRGAEGDVAVGLARTRLAKIARRPTHLEKDNRIAAIAFVALGGERKFNSRHKDEIIYTE